MTESNDDPAAGQPHERVHEQGALACPACGALHQRARRFCEECGAALTSRAPRAAARRRSRGARASAGADDATGAEEQGDEGRPSLDREGARLAHVALSRARSQLWFVRLVFWFQAVVHALAAISSFISGDAPAAGGVALAFAAIATLGALTLHRYPFGWTLGCAAFQTLLVIVIVAYGGIPFIAGPCALILWFAVPVMARAARILREHADLYDAEYLRGKRSTFAPKAEARARVETQRRLERRAGLRTLAIAAALLVVVGVGGFFAMQALSQPRERAPRLEAFRAALAAGDATAGEALCTRDYRGVSWRKATAILEREGWLPAGVALGAPEVLREGENFAEVRFALPRGDMRTMWRLIERDWCLDRVVFKGVRQD